MMFMSTLTKMSILKPHLVAEKAKEKKRIFFFSISTNKMTSHLLMEMQLICFKIFYFIF